jgi:hypothetical protein
VNINVNDSQYFAVSLCGNDKGRVYVVLYEENGYVFLADGKHRKISAPKKKKKKHIKAFYANKLIGYIGNKENTHEEKSDCEFQMVSEKAIFEKAISEKTISVSIKSEMLLTDRCLRRAIRNYISYTDLIEGIK